MIKNARIMYSTLGFVLFLLLATIVSTTIFFDDFSIQMLSIIILATGVVELGAVFIGCFLLDTEQNPVTDDDKEQLFQALTIYAQRKSSVFGLKIQWLVVFGKLYVPLLMLCCAQIASGLILLGFTVQIPTQLKFIAVVFFGTFLVLFFKSLLYRPDYPDYPVEVEATSTNFPNLLAVVNAVRKKVKAPKIHNIYVVPGDNCSVALYSDFFGFRVKNIMEIGLSLLVYFTEEEIKALLAHEMAHIGNRDTLMGYNAQVNIIRWKFLNQHVAREREVIRTLIEKFGIFYVDYLSIHIAAGSKPREYAADAVAANITSKEQFASMLYKIFFLDSLPQVSLDMEKMDDVSKVPHDYFTQSIAAMKESEAFDQAAFETALFSARSEYYDSHPTYIERLEALGLDSFTFHQSLKDVFPLDSGVKSVISFYDQDWRIQKIREFEYIQFVNDDDQRIIKEFNETDKDANERFEDGDEAMEVGWALCRIGKKDEAIQHFTKVAEAFPESDVPAYAIAVVQLQMGNEAGLQTVIQYANRNACAIEAAVSSIFDYFTTIKQPNRIEEYKDWLDEKRATYKEYQRELSSIRSSDIFKSVLTPSYEIMKPFYAKLSELKRIKAIYFLRKKCLYAEKGPLLVGVDVGFANTSKKDITQVELLLDEIMPHLDFEGYITQSYEYDMRFFLKHFMGAKGNMVYNRKTYFKRLAKENSKM